MIGKLTSLGVLGRLVLDEAKASARALLVCDNLTPSPSSAPASQHRQVSTGKSADVKQSSYLARSNSAESGEGVMQRPIVNLGMQVADEDVSNTCCQHMG